MRVVVPVVSPSRPGRDPVAAAAGAAAGARAVIRHCLARWKLEALTDDALLVVTELLTNAVRYGTPPWDVRMWLVCEDSGRRYVRLEVHDAGAGIDIDRLRARWRHPSGSLMNGGRGLFIVDTLASSWGDAPSGHGHTVWAELEGRPRRASGCRRPGG
ncbi:ATP-binding protein [Streptomyces enissocaesilis]|uniref:ATP-binding protein n=1 Tax=Streptomyces enissocaesilis TaxID=332589 RepID=UPI0031D1C54C